MPREVEGTHVWVGDSADSAGGVERRDALFVGTAGLSGVGLPEEQPLEPVGGSRSRAPDAHRFVHQRWIAEGLRGRLPDH